MVVPLLKNCSKKVALLSQPYLSFTKHTLQSASIAGLLLLSAACSPNIQQRGNPVDTAKLGQLTVGTSKKSEVQAVLGSPTYESPFTSNWYYATTTQRYTAFFRPQTTEAAVVTIGFDAAGVVSSVDTQTPEQADTVEATNRKIETLGEKPPIIQQLFGNVGRYVKPKNANP
jgi:outer membrane protein assembly factor BamE (lipoprotein component of BamABCDE complex)